MKLKDISTATNFHDIWVFYGISTATNFEDLKPYIDYLSDNMDSMTFGSFTAFKRTIEIKCKELNISLQELNSYVTKYQNGKV